VPPPILAPPRHNKLHVIAKRRSRRGDPEVWFFASLIERTSSQTMELDCRVGYAFSQWRWLGNGCPDWATTVAVCSSSILTHFRRWLWRPVRVWPKVIPCLS